MLKLYGLAARRPDMTHEQFVEYWRDHHAPLFSSQPIVKKTVRRYIQSRRVSGAPAGVALADFDGVAEIWFDDMNGFREYIESQNYQDVIRPDELKFIDPKRFFAYFCEDVPIIG